MPHITKEQFNQLVADGKMFKIENLFYGSIEDFDDNFHYGKTYEAVVDFANDNGSVLKEYTEEEHRKWKTKLYEGVL